MPEAAGRLRSAAGLLDALASEASPLPWAYFDDRGQHFGGQPYAVVGLTDADGARNVTTHTQPRGNESAELDAALIAVLSAAPTLLARLFREMADHLETDPVDGTCNAAALELADALLDRTGAMLDGDETSPFEPAVEEGPTPEPDVQIAPIAFLSDTLESVLMCPECRDGKTVNCAGQALNPVTDEFVPCATAVRS